jgi:hypothetical protein
MGAGDYVADPVSNEVIRTALKAEMERDRHKDDDRTVEQRRLDAAVNIFRRALDNGELGSTRSVRPHITVVTHVDDERVDATSEFGLRLSMAALERLMCDCELSRVVMRGKSEVLDVGRATRTVSAAQWRALTARDGGCRRRGCARPPAFCEAHHVLFWEHGGATDLANLVLLCWEHHHELHRLDLRPSSGALDDYLAPLPSRSRDGPGP